MPDKQENEMTQENVTRKVNQFLDDFFADNIAQSERLDPNYADLWRAMHKNALAGGKRLRPYFVLLAYAAYGGKNPQQVLPVAVAQELLHMSLLMHDDIIDKDYVRHGQPNVAGTMRSVYRGIGAGDNSEHYGNSAALIGGDLLLSAAYRIILDSSLRSQQKLVSMTRLSETIFFEGGGELLDTESSFRTTTTSQSLKIADFKTAQYSFVSPFVSGAELGGATKSQQRLLAEFGVALGIAFQLADDMLGMYGDTVVTGKSNLSDIREGKKTYLMLQALQAASAADKTVLTKCLGNPELTPAQADQVRQIVERSGARSNCLEKIATYRQQAYDVLEQLDISPAHRQTLRDIVIKATKRAQ